MILQALKRFFYIPPTNPAPQRLAPGQARMQAMLRAAGCDPRVAGTKEELEAYVSEQRKLTAPPPTTSKPESPL